MEDLTSKIGIHINVPVDVYRKLPADSISLVKQLSRSPLHYRHRRINNLETDPMRLGTAAHAAILEPDRFVKDFSVWDKVTESGSMSPRRGKDWDRFRDMHRSTTIITKKDFDFSNAMHTAVRGHESAMDYLRKGEPEVTLQWLFDARLCRGRLDWLTIIEDQPVIVGVKTTKDCRHFIFGSHAHKLGYHLQWAWYHDGYMELTGRIPKMIEIVVESTPPHAVAVYRITDDILNQGREEYQALLPILDRCQTSQEWPGPVEGEEDLSFPTYAYKGADEDLGELELEDNE